MKKVIIGAVAVVVMAIAIIFGIYLITAEYDHPEYAGGYA